MVWNGMKELHKIAKTGYSDERMEAIRALGRLARARVSGAGEALGDIARTGYSEERKEAIKELGKEV
jgi:hypothetical protein